MIVMVHSQFVDHFPSTISLSINLLSLETFMNFVHFQTWTESGFPKVADNVVTCVCSNRARVSVGDRLYFRLGKSNPATDRRFDSIDTLRWIQ